MKVKVQFHAIDFNSVVVKLDYKGSHKTARAINIDDLNEESLCEIMRMGYYDCDDEDFLEEIYSSSKYKACNEDNLVAEYTFKFKTKKNQSFYNRSFYNDLFKRTEKFLKED